MAKKNHQKKEAFLRGNYQLLPILAVICIVPFILRMYIYDSGLEQFSWYPQRDQEIDIFLYYRSMVLIAVAVVMAAILGYSICKEWKSRKNQAGIVRIRQAKWLIPLGIFSLMALLSTLFSEYRSYGFGGIYEQFESIWVVLAYCMITVYVFYFVRTREHIDIVQKGLFFLLAALGLLGVTQMTGNDFFETGIGKSLYVPGRYAELRDQLSFSFSGSGNHQVYLTFYNPNYVGVFAALILPVSIMLCAGQKEVKKRAAWGILSVVTFLCALASGSKAFLLSLIVIAVIGIVLFARKKMKHIPVILAGFMVFLTAGGIYMNYVNVDIVQYVKNALVPHKSVYAVEDFIIEPDYVTIRYNGSTISMQCEADEMGLPVFRAWDENGTEWPYAIDESYMVSFLDERIAAVTVMIYGGYDEYTYIGEIQADGHRYGFSKGNDGYTYINYAYKADEIIEAESAVFTDYDQFFSGRGYLWSRSIPMLKDTLILGTGADTYSLVFPQDDYIARTNAGYQEQLITKPHNLYLQYGIQYGVLALMCYLAVVVIYVAQSLKICWRADFKDVYSCLSLGILLGVLGYGIMGIANDSCVALAPLVWAVLGLGFAVNRIAEENLGNEEAKDD